MKTMDRPAEVTSAPERARRSTLLLAIVAVVALAVGALGGWFVRGDDDVGAEVAVEGVELTARQQEMLDVLDAYVEAWLVGDSDAVVSFFTQDGRADFLGREMDLDVLRDYVDRGSWSGLDMQEPLLVGEYGVTQFHEFGGRQYADVYEFTVSGEVLLRSHVIVR